jgi:peptide/nickel transport system substrate-binding protein
MFRRRLLPIRLRTAGAVALAVMIGSMASFPATSSAASKPTKGGSLTVVLPTTPWPDLDPAYNLEPSPDAPIENAIFGTLFQPNSKGVPQPDLATGFSYSKDGLTFKLFIRHGVTFQDGTPFNATAVAWNVQQDLIPANACVCLANFTAVSNVAASGADTVVFTLSRKDYALPSAFGNAETGFIISPTEVSSKGAGYAGQNPIGAGPFQVVSNQVSATISLTKNPHYWEKGHPYLQNLTFTTASSDQSEFDAISSGQAEVATGITTPSILKQQAPSAGLDVLKSPALSYAFVDLNSQVPPLNNPIAREALLYATYPQQIDSVLYDGLYAPTEGPETAGEQFFEAKVNGFLGWNNVTKAKALVAQLGGLSLTLNDTSGTLSQNQVIEALQTQWERAGINVTVKPPAGLPQFLAQIASGNWQAFYNPYGTFINPFLSSVNFFDTGGKYVGYSSPQATKYYELGTELANPTLEATVWHQLLTWVDTNAYTIPMFQSVPYVLTTKSVHGYNNLQAVTAEYENVWLS